MPDFGTAAGRNLWMEEAAARALFPCPAPPRLLLRFASRCPKMSEALEMGPFHPARAVTFCIVRTVLRGGPGAGLGIHGAGRRHFRRQVARPSARQQLGSRGGLGHLQPRLRPHLGGPSPPSTFLRRVLASSCISASRIALKQECQDFFMLVHCSVQWAPAFCLLSFARQYLRPMRAVRTLEPLVLPR